VPTLHNVGTVGLGARVCVCVTSMCAYAIFHPRLRLPCFFLAHAFGLVVCLVCTFEQRRHSSLGSSSTECSSSTITFFIKWVTRSRNNPVTTVVLAFRVQLAWGHVFVCHEYVRICNFSPAPAAALLFPCACVWVVCLCGLCFCTAQEQLAWGHVCVHVCV
jgi:hypothetical protein